MGIYNLISFIGIFALMVVAWLFSTNRRLMNWRAIGWGVGLQLALGAMVFHAPHSKDLFQWLNGAVVRILGAAKEGQMFVFGPLALSPGETAPGGEASPGFILAFQVLPVIIFFSALMSLLYYWRIMPAIIRAFAWLFTRLMRISGAESLCTAANIFVGVESSTAIRPYLARMTRSEFCTILTAGMATVASSTMAFYILTLKDRFDTIAGHLISASLMSAPAAIVMSKILLPESEEPVTLGRHVKADYDRESGAISAIIGGAMAGLKLVAGIVALLIAFYGLVSLVDLAIGAATSPFTDVKWTLEKILGYVFYPFAVLMGVPPSDAATCGQMLGTRAIKTEIPAYVQLANVIRDNALHHPRTAIITAYALCGFAHVASMAIFVGGIAALVPERRKDIAAAGPRALLAATLACLMTGAVAGTFYYNGAIVLTPGGK